MGLDARNPVFGSLRLTQAQTSLRIRAVRSAPLLLAFGKLALSETPKTGFVASRPIYMSAKNTGENFYQDLEMACKRAHIRTSQPMMRE